MNKSEVLAIILPVIHLFNKYFVKVFLYHTWIVKYDNLKCKAIVRHYSIAQICLYSLQDNLAISGWLKLWSILAASKT